MTKTLSNDLNVSEIDVKCLLNSVVNSMRQDKVNPEKLNKEQFVELVLSYVGHAVKKFDQFVSIRETRGKESFDNHILSLLGA